MAVVRPFKAIRPTPELSDKVAALPYDVMNSDEAREILIPSSTSTRLKSTSILLSTITISVFTKRQLQHLQK